jgi:hypothetical protein
VWKLLSAQLGRPSSCTSTIDNIVAVAGEHQAHPMRSGSGPATASDIIGRVNPRARGEQR